MSRTLSVSAHLVEASFADVIRSMTDSSWEIRDVTGVSYLPIDAEDVADWKMFSEDSAELALEVCRRRAAEGKVAGVVLLLKDSDSGGSFVWTDEADLLVSLSVNVTDPWDLNRWVEAIVRPLDASGVLESFSVSYN